MFHRAAVYGARYSCDFGAGPARSGAAVKPNCPCCSGLGWVCENRPHPIPLKAGSAEWGCRASATARKDTKSQIFPASSPNRRSSDRAVGHDMVLSDIGRRTVVTNPRANLEERVPDLVFGGLCAIVDTAEINTTGRLHRQKRVGGSEVFSIECPRMVPGTSDGAPFIFSRFYLSRCCRVSRRSASRMQRSRGDWHRRRND
jgi:hypothetical protein